ncbi:MAG TPA: SPOR domain-containing protein [Ramlibacter sp.]|uniref:SPOR domain-containing protein n=1 Tax=Ramlibacter sp. TaxID=1917967 RepID=UPI002C7C4789|nr:SPOR domain-containing protein [Ramlibacter sp.]HVZ47030.1 SPOR domain-containing protein [Ramlibacter sp.]
MRRLIVLVLLLANAAFFAWSQGMLLAWGFGPAQQSEPQRIAQQIQPESIRILKPDEAKRVDAAVQAARPPDCMQAGPLDDSQVAALRSALDSWPAGSYSIDPMVEPARWIVYMGKYASADLVAHKKAELRQLGITFEAIANPALEPGLSLGGYASEAEAKKQLDTLAQRGVRTAKVVQEHPEVKGQKLTLAALDDALRSRLDELKPALGAKSALKACR